MIKEVLTVEVAVVRILVVISAQLFVVLVQFSHQAIIIINQEQEVIRQKPTNNNTTNKQKLSQKIFPPLNLCIPSVHLLPCFLFLNPSIVVYLSVFFSIYYL